MMMRLHFSAIAGGIIAGVVTSATLIAAIAYSQALPIGAAGRTYWEAVGLLPLTPMFVIPRLLIAPVLESIPVVLLAWATAAWSRNTMPGLAIGAACSMVGAYAAHGMSPLAWGQTLGFGVLYFVAVDGFRQNGWAGSFYATVIAHFVWNLLALCVALGAR